MSLSILCVSLGERYSYPFIRSMQRLASFLRSEFILIADGERSNTALRGLYPVTAVLDGQGPSLEPILDDALGYCNGDYVLRLDDDEACSKAMVTWLKERRYEEHDHWCFPRTHLWPDRFTVIMNPTLYPDLQTRLSVRAKAGGRKLLHAGSPYGPGEVAPVAIEHYKFIVRTREERQALAARYDEYRDGLGTGPMLPFNLPELAYNRVVIAPKGNGQVPWATIDAIHTVPMRSL